MTAADCSTALLEFMRFVYGNPIMRLSGVGVAISAAVNASWIHALGLVAATSLKPAHSPAMSEVWSATERPADARSAFSNIGYTCTGMKIPRACSAGWLMASS